MSNTNLDEKIKVANERIKELELLIKNWKQKDNKTIMRCKLGDDPWDGYQPHDTSLGNRLYHWEQAQLLYGAEYVLSFEKKYYPESEFLNFPNSIFEDDGSWDNTLENLQDQWEETWLQNMAGQIKLEDNIISTITVKDPKNDEKFKTLFGKYHGVHLRRGSGMWFTEDDIASIPADLKIDYLELYNKLNHNHDVVEDDTYKYIQDSDYFDQMDIEKEYYIASDIPSKYYAHWKDTYKIVDKNDLIDEFKKICPLNDMNQDVFESIMDFIALAYSKRILAHGGSTFNLTAARWQITPIVNIGRRRLFK